MSTSIELYPSMLFRAAGGERSIEAAVILLSETGLLRTLHHCITVEADAGLAWLDWQAVIEHAERRSSNERAVILTAAALATEVHRILEPRHRAIELAFTHLLT